MNRAPALFATLALLLGADTGRVRAAETNAVIPYKALDDMMRPIANLDQTKLEVRVSVLSTNQAVQPSDISLAIKSVAKGLIPVTVGTNGQIFHFSQTKELRRENPGIVSNQPKGSLRLQVSVQLPLPEGLKFGYKRLGEGVVEMNKAIKAQAGMMSLFAPKIEGVIFLFPEASAEKATVEIATAAGRRKYTADKKGWVKLKLEKSLLAENPEVEVSEKPRGIAPDMSDL